MQPLESLESLESLDDSDARREVVRLTSWSSLVRQTLGGRALLHFRIAQVVLLTPAVLLAAYSLYSNRLALLIMVLLSLWGFWSSSPCPTGIGAVGNMLTAIVGFVYSAIVQDRLFACASVLPGLTWLGSSIVLGMTAQNINAAVRASGRRFESASTAAEHPVHDEFP